MINSSYKEGNSPVHRGDPRFKLLFLVLWVTAAILPVSLTGLSLYYSFLALLIGFSLSPGDVIRPLKTIFPILILVLILTPPFHRSGEELLNLGGWYVVTLGGLEEALTLMARFSVITNAFFLFFRTTTVEHLILSLQWYGLSYNSALMVTIAFRYIPSLLRLYRDIQDAHALRRPVPGEGIKWNPLAKFRGIFPTLVSIMINAIKAIPALSMALEIRGFGRKNKRGVFRGLPALSSVLRQIPLFLSLLGIIVLFLFL